MKCRPHSKILRMLVVYNVFSIIISLIWASPYIYQPYKRLQAKITHLFKKPSRTRVLTRGAYTTNSVFYAVIGSIALSLLAPILAGYLVWQGYG